MPNTSRGLPYPTPNNANNPPYDFQKLAEATDRAITTAVAEAKNYTNGARTAIENGFYVDGTWYKRSGVTEYRNLGGWTASAGTFSYRTLAPTVPVDIPPTGYAVKYEVVFSDHICVIAGGDMWNNNAKGKAANVFILRMWNSTEVESVLRLRWEVYKKA